MIELTDKTKILILVAIIGVVIFFFVQNRMSEDEGTHNEGSLTQEYEKPNIKNITEKEPNEKDLEESISDIISEEEQEQEEIPKRKAISARATVAELQENDANILKKFRTRNSSRDGSFVSSNYADGRRGAGRGSNLDKFFEEGHPLDEKIGYQKNDPNSQDIQYANYVPGKQRKLRDVDKFNAEALLPKEKHKDWFDDPYESTSVKNTHLINIYRPIGVNTVSTTLKNANRQLRADVPNPKLVVSPFMNSSIEPDTNIRNSGLCL
jgi:hypothetical protein